MKRKAGIFDPWRQDRPKPPPPPPEPLYPHKSQLDVDAPSLQPVRFAGKGAGITVWLPIEDFEERKVQARTNILVALHRLMTSDQRRIRLTTKWGIFDQVDKKAVMTNISDGVRNVYVIGDIMRTMQNIALALREAAQKEPQVASELEALGIQPYLAGC